MKFHKGLRMFWNGSRGCNLEGSSRNIYSTLNAELRDRPLTRFQHSPFYHCCKY